MLVEGGGSCTLDFVLSHTCDGNLVGIESVSHEELFDALCTSDGYFLLGLDVDGIGLDVTLNLECQVGMSFEHLDVV